MPDPAPDTPPDDRARLQRIEETQSFIEHTADQLSARLIDLEREILRLSTRLAAAERRLESLAAPPSPPEPPNEPHLD